MKNLKYTITFHNDWHCGSGLSSGADADALVVKDKDRLPFIPGKTLKGLLREAVLDLLQLGAAPQVTTEMIDKAFGKELTLSDTKDKHFIPVSGCCFFSNAVLDSALRTTIIKEGLQSLMYSNVARTAIDSQTGIALDHSLRTQEVCIPCILHAHIADVPDDLITLFGQAMAYIKRLGVNRNRGLGRCTITLNED